MILSLLASAMVAPAAAPAPKPTTLAKVRDWSIVRMPGGQCKAVAGFGADKAMIVWVNVDGTNGLTVLFDKSSLTTGDALPLILKLGDREYSGDASVVSAGDTVRGLNTRVDGSLLPQLRKSRALTVRDRNDDLAGPATYANLAFEDMAPVVEAMAGCTGRPVGDSAITAIPTATAPVFLNKAAIITSDDYPPAAHAAEAQGNVRYRIAVSTAGQVTDCDVMTSSGDADLDKQSCVLLRRRARLTPAKDSAGKPVPGTLDSSVSWRLPG